MRKSLRSFVSLGGALTAALLLAGCSGGGDSSGSVQVRCNDGAYFCLVSCDLGCGSFGCAVTEVAENQRLRFVFNQAVDRNSVTSSSFSIRTAAGVAPEGELFVDGNTVQFVPAIQVINGIGTFGFRRNESYIISIAGANSPGQRLRSVSGDILGREFTCTVTATRGILDEDNQPPRAELIAPANLEEAPLDSTIILRFSEVIDTTPFLTALSPATPIQYTLRRSRLDPLTNTRDCDPNGSPLLLEGVPRTRVELLNGKPVSVISVKPNINLPGRACVEINVTADVRDLSGRGAVPVRFEFFTAESQVGDIRFEEQFINNSRMDIPVSGGVWQNGARPAQLGGDGRHGSFSVELGQGVGNNTYVFDTDSLTIPGTNTFSGQPETVTDGRFFFTDFRLPENTTIRFEGSNPATIFVRGVVEILGDIEANGQGVGVFQASLQANVAIAGQPGCAAGAGGGAGGRGGNRCLGTGPTNIGGVIQEAGQDGGDIQVLAGHAYAAQAAGTGGQGSGLHPSHGLFAQLTTPIDTYTIQFVFNGAMNAGGGGGGYSGPGGDGLVPNPQPVVIPGTLAPGGTAFNVLPLPAGSTSLNHFLVGGSGGGGGGSHTFAALRNQAGAWRAGSGGTGGGGACASRGGSASVVGTDADLTARGGDGVTINGDNPNTPTFELASSPTSWGVAAPGGAGSGGSILLQASTDLQIDGRVNVRGGIASQTGNIQPLNLNIPSRGGAGADGFYRFEAGGTTQIPGTGFTPALNAANNIGPLVDRDQASGSQSLWRGSGLVFPPTWVRYELEVDTDGNGTPDTLFSDDASVPNSVGPANDPLGAVRVKFQGARINTTTNEPIEGTLGPYRDFCNELQGASLNLDAATGFRFVLLFNTQLFPDAIVTRLTVIARG